MTDQQRARRLAGLRVWAHDVSRGFRMAPAWHHEDVVFLLAEIDRLSAAPVLEAEADTHRCSGCGHRWSGLAVKSGRTTHGAELCGDCWRKAQPVVHAAPVQETAAPQWREVACFECSGSGGDVISHADGTESHEDCRRCGGFGRITIPTDTPTKRLDVVGRPDPAAPRSQGTELLGGPDAEPAPTRYRQALEAIVALDFQKDSRNRDDFYSGAPQFVRAWTIAKAALEQNQPPTDPVCQHGTALDVHCCHCHSGFIFDKDHECPPALEWQGPDEDGDVIVSLIGVEGWHITGHGKTHREALAVLGEAMHMAQGCCPTAPMLRAQIEAARAAIEHESQRLLNESNHLRRRANALPARSQKRGTMHASADYLIAAHHKVAGVLALLPTPEKS